MTTLSYGRFESENLGENGPDYCIIQVWTPNPRGKIPVFFQFPLTDFKITVNKVQFWFFGGPVAMKRNKKSCREEKGRVIVEPKLGSRHSGKISFPGLLPNHIFTLCWSIFPTFLPMSTHHNLEGYCKTHLILPLRVLKRWNGTRKPVEGKSPGYCRIQARIPKPKKIPLP